MFFETPSYFLQRNHPNTILISATHKAFLALVGHPAWAHPSLGTSTGAGQGRGGFICVKICAWIDVHPAALFQGGKKISGWYSFAENWSNLGLAKKRRKETKAFFCITWHLMGKMQFSFLSIWQKYILLADILLRGDKSFVVRILVGIEVLGDLSYPCSWSVPLSGTSCKFKTSNFVKTKIGCYNQDIYN